MKNIGINTRNNIESNLKVNQRENTLDNLKYSIGHKIGLNIGVKVFRDTHNVIESIRQNTNPKSPSSQSTKQIIKNQIQKELFEKYSV